MPSEEMEYIVKAKDSDIEIKSFLKDKIRIFLITSIVLYFILLLLVLEPGSIISTTQQLFFYTFFYMMFIILLLVNFGWKFRVKNRNLYVDITLKHYVIKYSNIINITYHKGYHYNHILIQYLENEEIKQIELAVNKKEYYKWKEIREFFITNKDLEERIQSEDDYFYVRDENPLKVNIQNKRMSFNNILGLLVIAVFISLLIINLLLEIFFKFI